MHLPPLPKKLTFHPTPLSLRQAHQSSDASVVLLDGEMTFADFWPHFDQPMQGRTLGALEARRLVRRLLRCGVVPAWQGHADDAWAVARVHEALGELRAAGVTAAALAGAEELAAWVNFLGAYEEALQAHRWLDAAERQRLAVLQVAQGAMPPPLREVERVEVLAGTELLGARLDVLRAFAARGVAVRVHMPWDEERPHAFAWTEGLLHALETRGHQGMSIAFNARHGRGALRPIVSALYTGQAAELQPPAAPAVDAAALHLSGSGSGSAVACASGSGSRAACASSSGSGASPAFAFASASEPAQKPHPVVVRCAPAGQQHAESVAAQVAAWLTADVPAQAIAVVAPTAVMATDVVRALHGARIGCAHNVRRSLAQSRIARLYLAGLRAEGGMASGAWWAELWETCGSTVRTPEGSWRPARVVRALRRAGWATERRWGLGVEGTARGLAQALPESAATEVSEAMARVCAPLANMPPSGTLAEMAPTLLQWAQTLARAWQAPAPSQPTLDAGHPKHGLPAAHATNPAPAAEALGADAWLQAAQQGDAEAASMLQQCILDALQGDAATHDMWTRSQLADWLEAACQERMYLAVPRDAQGVHVLRPEDAVGCRFRCLLFAGADMEAFPRPLPAHAFLPETQRIAINRRLGPRLLQYAPMLGRGALPAVARDLWLWMEVAASVSEQWVVTLQESSGEAMLGPSELVDELLRVSGAAMTWAPPQSCIDATVPPAWVPRLWAAEPELLAGPMQQVAPTLPARLERRWRAANLRTSDARVPAAVAASLRRYFEHTVHSASRMDVLGMCAFRYVAAAIWGLGIDDDVAWGATPREQGSAAHAALHQVYDTLMRGGGMREARLAPQQALGAAQQVMHDHAERILAETQVHPLLQPALLADTAAAALAQLTRDLASGIAHEPVALEYTFDDRNITGPDALSVEHPQGHSRVRVRGSIDRVDVTPSDLWVLDYKRTVRPRHPDRHFQLALYAAIALRDLLPQAGQVRVGWAGLRPAKIHWASDLPDTPEGLMTHLRERLFARIDPVAQGHFSPDPDAPSTCERCDFRRLCRLDDREATAACAPTDPQEASHG